MRCKFMLLLLISLLIFPAIGAFSYQVILKNGKTVEGTFISENDAQLVIQDSSGIRMVFKKAAIDSEKTRLANTPAPPAPAPIKVEEPQKNAPAAKKPAHVVTREELEKLREKYDLNQGMYRQESETEQPEALQPLPESPDQVPAENWRAEAQMLLNRIKEAEAAYLELNDYCKDLEGASASGMVLLDNPRTFYPLDLAAETKKICERAERAKAQYKQAKQDYRNFMEYARQQGIPPGDLRTYDEYETKIESEPDDE